MDTTNNTNTPIPAFQDLHEADKTKIKAFDCGDADLNDYLKRYARQSSKKGLGACRLLVCADGAIIGYFALATAQTMPDELPSDYPIKLPQHPVPCVRLTRMAVDKEYQGQGWGAIMMVEACRRIVHASEFLGITALVVDAKNERAAAFYAQFGFVPLKGKPLTLIVPLAWLRQAFDL